MAKVRAASAAHGNAYFSSVQTAGKGQRGKLWHTDDGVNIALSIILDVQTLNASRQFQLSVAVALGCYDFFSKYAGDETTIKWPNDIYWRDRKAGGILIENVFYGNEWRFAVAGIGFNINQTLFDNSLKKPVSLKQVTGKTYDLVSLAKELHLTVLKRFDQLTSQSFAGLLKEYNQLLFRLNATARFKKGNMVFDVTVLGVTEHGQLITTDVIKGRFNFGEVSWVL